MPIAESSPTPMPFQPLTVLRRRARPALVTFGAAMVAALLLTFLWPARYLSTGVILIEQQEVPTDLVRSTISSYADQRLQVISQRVMTTSNLMRIIQQYDLYPSERRRKGREVIIARMREDVKFRTISVDVIDPRQGRPTQATIAFTLGYESRSADLAARVANELASLYLQENLATRRQQTEDTTRFLAEEAARLSTRINELETKTAEFKARNFDAMPDVMQVNMTQLARLDDERGQLESRERATELQLRYLETQLQQAEQGGSSGNDRVPSPAERLRLLRNELVRTSSLYSAEHPDVRRLKREIAALEKSVLANGGQDATALRDLAEAEAALARARDRYSPDHPDVLRYERLIAGLRAAVTATRTTPAQPAIAADADSLTVVQLRLQRDAAAAERTALAARRKELQRRTSDLESRLESAPGVERDYTALRRDLDATQSKYREVSQKQMEAQLAETLESERKGERFSLIEPPLVPEEPTSPNRRLLFILGILFALAVSLAVVAVIETLDDTLHGSGAVVALLTSPPLAVIPRFETDDGLEHSRAPWQRLRWLAAGVILLILLLAAVHVFYRPLDIVWILVLQRLGL